VGTEDEIEMRESAQDRIPLLLGDAAPHTERPPRRRCLPLPEHPEVAVEPMLGLLADRAGVDQKELRQVRVPDLDVAMVIEEVRDLLGVVGVHLAAVAADEEAPHTRQDHLLPPPRSPGDREIT
jgi:hypothetical protein